MKPLSLPFSVCIALTQSYIGGLKVSTFDTADIGTLLGFSDKLSNRISMYFVGCIDTVK